MPMTTWRMRDLDNRGDDSDPYEIINYPAEIANYVDGPVRSDLTHPDEAKDLFDRFVTACKNADLDTAQKLGPHFSIYIDLFTDDQETPQGDPS